METDPLFLPTHCRHEYAPAAVQLGGCGGGGPVLGPKRSGPGGGGQHQLRRQSVHHHHHRPGRGRQRCHCPVHRGQRRETRKAGGAYGADFIASVRGDPAGAGGMYRPAFVGDHGYAVGHHRAGGEVSENLHAGRFLPDHL